MVEFFGISLLRFLELDIVVCWSRNRSCCYSSLVFRGVRFGYIFVFIRSRFILRILFFTVIRLVMFRVKFSGN